ncbi:hypothetical protein F4V91_08760 [Neorhizobium galegae]|uniref:Uncharacterized protein n=1 Tax=Neorhizobium galegae TaxID=399 RepID=A0A6A1TPV1_NEOGA|nr:hypothetical protein [Neorhizobium galegae]KAB1086509.1 hypothetical protein F4V91_08760 [Neorhizobium galegae]
MEYNEGESASFVKWKINHDTAVTAHARHTEDGRTVFTSALNMGLEALRTAAAINGGAVIAVFAFLGATFSSENGETAAIRLAMTHPAIFFAVGALLSGLASGASYFSQIMYSTAHEAYEMSWEPPYLVANSRSENSEWWGDFWRAIAVSLVLGSYGCLSYGLLRSYSVLAVGGMP